MNVEQYIQQELNVTGVDMMGDEMPLDSNCGNACKLCIDAAKSLCDEMDTGTDYYDCNYYPFLGHVFSAFGDNEEIDKLRSGDVTGLEIIEMASQVCQCYIFG